MCAKVLHNNQHMYTNVTFRTLYTQDPAEIHKKVCGRGNRYKVFISILEKGNRD